jgi:hypothetical protein
MLNRFYLKKHFSLQKKEAQAVIRNETKFLEKDKKNCAYFRKIDLVLRDTKQFFFTRKLYFSGAKLSFGGL